MHTGNTVNATLFNITERNQPFVDLCSDRIPTTAELFRTMRIEGHILIAILILFTLLTIYIYVDEVRFIQKNIRRGTRTMWVVACYPVYASTGLLAVVIPRSGVVIDMIASGFFSTCLYNFGRLMIRYMGGTGRLFKVFDSGRIIAFNTLPACCCCLCLPRAALQLSIYNYIRGMIMQVVICRPILTFLAVVLWADGTFMPGTLSFKNPHTYIAVANVVSTMMAVYGLMLLRNAFRPELEKLFVISGKIMAVQMALLCSIFPNIIINILVTTNVIRCSSMFPSKARGEAIYHAFLVLIMLPLALVGQRVFRRASDTDSYLDRMKTNNCVDGHTDGVDADGSLNWEQLDETKI